MGKINVLGKNVSELIAAGEVIERPASIVKELLENSIDANASAITVEIKRGGISYIRITDNGCGMIKDDVEVAFLRHATSKIKESDDLDHIATLGFRGEALASIAAVSRVEMMSKTSDMQFGTKIMLEGGDILDVDEVGCPTGTTIIVRDLFYNVPARLKFLKRDFSEGNSISGIIDKIALSHPEISFKLISDNKIKTHTPGNGDLLSAIHAVFGKEVSSTLIPVEYEINGILAKGYISNTSVSRTNRAMQHFFVNSRYVKSKTCLVALEEGYKNSIMVGRYPSCVLNITVPVDTVDVNVHPAKIEIRFVNERVVFDAIYFAVKSTLSNNDVLKPVAQPQNNTQVRNLLSTFQSKESEQTSIQTVWEEEEPSKATNTLVSYQDNFEPNKQTNTSFFSNEVEYKTTPKMEQNEFSYIKPQNLVKTQENIVVNLDTGEVIEPIIEVKIFQPPMPFVRVIGELFKTYILFEVEDNFLLLDKHAAHERIIFEKLKNSISTDDRQVLLKPIITAVSNEEMQVLNDHVELLDRLGFLFDEFANNSVIIREVPLVLSAYNISDIFLDIANKLIENRRNVTSDIFEHLLHSIACRSAVKANDTNSIEDLTELLKQVYANDEIRHCPHGRPVAISMSRGEIEKKFGRI
ncbi:MAG: DNA mismatch repair endonuclease MutL [Oscillospiraceae bacterium]